MDAESVLEQARSGHPPSEWNVWPLRRDYVLTSAMKWGLLGVVGLAMFIPTALLTIPSDFVGTSTAERLLATLMLTLLAAMAFGGVGIALYDVWRLMRTRDFWLIITPELFVKAEPGRITQTPLENVADVTLKGVRAPSDSADTNNETGGPMPQFFMGRRMVNFANAAGVRGVSRQRARGNTSLAYRDSRDDKVVVVCTDDAFDHMAAIYQILRERAAVREDQVWRASLRSPRS